ncbi:MBL-fold metallo-hydrolase superfamily [Candidatus Syntrophocurvum alkaliphilum]|uniref:MBL-fold metallo-hydrolase superfamily n=1 Tax=Candidatus Syntrophocurvum alkaliphilum TaxID=2293317 RepID=A0A6I6DII5_9FIRM|nr:MBL fold metallo-hydrolase [Candidatus Syntrophocurvum alkaliphilum]QGU00833.1 MBL-fold metallo-hydrolase superfamily [Candidatus Syntrophocurvum alkaliphilum]
MKRISDNVIVLGNGFLNYYIVGNKEAAIIECGISAGVELFKKDWVQLQEKPNIKYILAMHSHFDHVCGIPSLKELFPDAKVVASEVCKKLLSKERIVKAMFQGDSITTDSYIKNELLENKPVSRDIEEINVDMIVKDGDCINLDNELTLEILETPGHSPCSISAYLANDKVMFVSDATGYKAEDGKFSPVFFQDYDTYLNTINRLKSYPTQVLGVAHGDIPTGNAVNSFYQESLKAAYEAFDTISNKLKDGYSEQELAEEMYNIYIKGALALYPKEMMLGSMHLLIKNVKAKLE